MNINRDYLIINDVKKSNITLDNGSMFFYITDKNTQNIFVNLVINVSKNDLIQKYANIENAEDYTLTMNIVKPDNTYKIVEGKLHDKENAIFEFDLKEDCCDEIGTYKCELLTKCNINNHEEITTSNKLTYKVKSSVLNDLDNIVEAPEYPLVIQLFDKLSDIDQYEEDRRANELARQLAEEQRQARFDALEAGVVHSVQVIDDKVVEVESRISTKEQAVDELIVNTKADIDNYKEAKDQEIDEYKVLKDTEINNAIAAQDNKIDEAINAQNDRIAVVESNDVAQDNRLDILENKDTLHESRLYAVESKNAEQDNRLDIAENRLANIGNDITNTMQPIIDEHTSRLNAIEAIDVAQNNRLDAIEAKNQQQDDRLLDIEKVNKKQEQDIRCLYVFHENTIDITEEGNSIYLQNSNNGFTIVDEIKGNTLVNCNKEPGKELILNGNINTSGYNTVTITEGVDGGLIDVALEGNTLVNVSKTKDSSCKPVITGNTLWIDNATEEMLTAFDESKNLRLQSSFEDKLVTQEMIDNGEEISDNLGKYKVEYKSTREDGTVGNIKTLYLNSPLLEGDTIEEKDDGVYHVHRYTKVVLDGSEDEAWTDQPRGWFNTTLGFMTRANIFSKEDSNAFCNRFVKKFIWDETEHMHFNKGIINFTILKSRLQTQDTAGFRQWLQQNPVTAVYELEEPTYELIEQSTLVIPSYTNGHLDFNTAVPVEKVEFKSFSKELTYLYPSTSYTVQFVSDRATLADLILGGTLLLSQSIVAGLNRISITTPSELIDNKLIINGNGIGPNISKVVVTDTDREFGYFEGMKSIGECEELAITSANSDSSVLNTQTLAHGPLRAVGDVKDRYVLIDGNWYIEKKCGIRAYQEGDKDNYKTDLVNTVYPLEMPTYEEIDYNPFEVYSGATHISTNSTIPTNITVKNHGYNCLLKPGTTYTISSNLGLNTVTTPAVLTEDCLRFMDTDTSDVTTMKDVLILEGDWTTKPNIIPANFSGLESAFEQEYDAEKGKYKVNVKVVNEDKTRESNITFYINEPLRGVGTVKDRIYVKNDKVTVQRNCGIRPYEDGDFGTYPTDKVDTVYLLAKPTYEEAEYDDTKLFIESFKDSTLFYNSNVPVTSKVHYSYSVPIVDKVTQTASITDEQDSMIIDLATQVAVMEMMLM